jgi:hypothetical protein
MWWVVAGAVGLTLCALGFGIWLLTPTLRTFRGPAFEPVSKDEASVEQAQQTRMVDGGGGL